MVDKGSLRRAPIDVAKCTKFLGKVTFLLAEIGLNTDELIFCMIDVVCTAMVRFQLDPDQFVERVFLPHLAAKRASMGNSRIIIP